MSERTFVTPQYTTAEEIRKIRKQLGLTQKEFAQLINCSKPTVERWERETKSITGPVVLLLKMLEQYPEFAEQMQMPEKEYPLRLWYMHENTLCTLIDVDDVNKQVCVKNYTNHVMFRAFGNVEMPDYDMYENFLKSRCFPESRDKMKLILKDLDLPFYDPFLIIEKTEGRMAEDNFWIKIER
ncbi:MAG: helix-turn-helix domain-containing protein [Lachnospiraceae bacterium]|nr:helix-turn-helix domain-containing protein [Lachnospiraceae bacterium]